MSMWEADQGPTQDGAVKIMEGVPCDRLPMVLEWLVPYHTREKMHRVGAAGRPNDRPLKSAPRRTRPDVSPLEPREGVRYPPVYNSGGI